MTHARNGRVLSASMDQINVAATIAVAIDAYFDPVGERLGYHRDEPVEVWLDGDWAMATTFRRCIVLNPYDRRLEPIEGVIAHELGHWHMVGTPLERNLPHLLREGLADCVAGDLLPQWGSKRHAVLKRILDAARTRGGFDQVVARASLSTEEWAAHPDNDRIYELHALGFGLVDRIGIDDLRAAAERGPVTLDDILAMAGVGPDGSGLFEEVRPEGP